MTPTTKTRDLIDLLLAEHAAIELTFDEFLAEPRKDWTTVWSTLKTLLVAHETAEEQVVYPALRAIDGGAEIAEERISEQEEASGRIAVLDSYQPDSDDFMRGIGELREAVLTHARHEEQTVFRMLRTNLVQQDLYHLGEAYLNAKG